MSTDEGGGKKRGLGRGLSSLLGEEETAAVHDDPLRPARDLPIEHLFPGPYQPRRAFSDEELNSLAESIREKGILQPILVRESSFEPGRFEIIAGERRWRAAQMAQLHSVPVVVHDFQDREVLEIALIENVQRQDLSPLEEAAGYERLADEFGHTQEEIAQAVGKSRSHVANIMRLMSLPAKVADHLEAGRISAGHARALLGSDEAERLVDDVVAKGLNVRQTEALVRKGTSDAKSPSRQATPAHGSAEKDADTKALEKSIADQIGLKSDISFSPDTGKGSITLFYEDLEQLDMVLAKLTGGPVAPNERGEVLEEVGQDFDDLSFSEEPDAMDLASSLNFDDEDDAIEESIDLTPEIGLRTDALPLDEEAVGDDDDELEVQISAVEPEDMMNRMASLMGDDEDEEEEASTAINSDKEDNKSNS